jgi:hypothetical protein
VTRARNRTLLQSLGFIPARPTKAELLKSRREFKGRIRQKRKEFGDEMRRLRKSVSAGRRSSTRKLEQLFHEVYGREMNPRELAAIQGGTTVAKKRKPKKKRNPRKCVMPPGLRKYWAKKRAKKNPRRRKKAKRNPRVRVRTRTVIKYRTRTVKVRSRRRRKANPQPRRSTRINLKGFTAGQLKRVASAIRSATGKRVRIVKP